MNEPEKPKKGWGILHWSIVIGVLVLCLSLVVPVSNSVINLGYQQRQAQQGKEIIRAFQIFANDNGSTFPDVRAKLATANQTFRELIKHEYVESEHLFGGEISPYHTDGVIGEAPDFKEAVQPGENHWVVLGGLGTYVNPAHPVIYENALDASWPPRWDPGSVGRPVRGHLWRGNKILVGLVDGSISIVKTRRVGGILTLPEPMLMDPKGKPWEDIKVLDIEEKK